MAHTIRGNAGRNFLTGSNGNDRIIGFGGDDTLHGGAGNDLLRGGSGNDQLFGGAGHDVLVGGSGSDMLDGGSGNDCLFGGSGNDSLKGGSGHDLLLGGSGNDSIDGGSGNDLINGGSGNDTIDGGEGCDWICEDDGDDVIDGGSGHDVIFAGSGNDVVDAGTGHDFVSGGSGDDTINGGEGHDWLVGGSGNDQIRGGDGNDVVFGGSGHDTISGNDGHDWLVGGSGDDSIDGGSGHDILIGDSSWAHSWLRGDDTLKGGAGNDIILAGRGDDEAVYELAQNTHNRDFYDGGGNVDILTLKFTGDEWQRADVQADVAAYLQFVAAHTNGSTGEADHAVFQFSAFGLRAKRFETLKIVVDGVVVDPDNQNQAPTVAGPVIIADVSEDDGGAATINLLDGASDADGDTLSVTGIAATFTDSDGNSGSVTFTDNGDGAVSVDPSQFNGLGTGDSADVTVTFTIDDGNGGTVNNIATFTVNGRNDGPAVAGPVTVADLSEDDATATINLLDGASDADGDTLSVSGIAATFTDSNGNSGSVTFTDNGDGTISIDPSQFNGLGTGDSADVTVTFTIDDGNGGTVNNVATFTVNGRNDGPAVAGPVTVADMSEDDGATTISLLDGASDADGDTLSVSGIAATFADSDGNTGSVTFTDNGDGTISVDPSQFNGLGIGDSADVTVTFTIDDGNGGTVNNIATFTVNGQNDGPVVAGPVIVADMSEDDGATTINLLDGASDADGDSLSVTGISATFTDSDGNSGSVTFTDNGDGTISVDPGQFNGLGASDSADVTVTFTIDDGSGGTVGNTAAFTVNGQNDGPAVAGPVIVADMSEDDGATTISLLDGASDADGDTLSVSGIAATFADSDGNTGSVTFTDNGDGTISVDPSQFNGLGTGDSADVTVTFTVDDGNGGTVNNVATFTVNGQNDGPAVAGPVIVADMSEDDGATTINLLDGASDADGDTLSLTGVAATFTDSDGNSGSVTVTDNGDGTISVDPSQFNGLGAGDSADVTVTFTIDDGSGGTVGNIAAFTVNGQNDGPAVAGPVIVADMSEDDGATTINLLDGASDADGDTLSLTGVAATFTDSNGNSGSVTSTDNGDGTISIDPSQFNGLGAGDSADVTVTFTIDDGNGGTVNNIATFTVNGRNDGPAVAGPVTVADLSEDDATATINLLDGASDADGDTLSVSGIAATFTDSDGNTGSVTFTDNGDGTVSIDPGQFNGLGAGDRADVTVTFTVDDGNGGNIGNIATFAVNGQNDGPAVAGPVTIADVSEDDRAAMINLLDGTSDADGDTLSVSDIAATFADNNDGSGTVTFIDNGDGTISIDPGQFNGLGSGDSADVTVTYTIDDGNGGTVNNTASFTVIGDNDSPALAGTTPVTFSENAVNSAPQLLSTTASFSDAEGNFDGGSLLVGGLLNEDTVSINDQGTGLDQIGFDGTDVTFEGTVIGTASGGNAGNDFTVTFNSAANPAAIQALLQNLTYANASNDPTPSRDLTIVVTDSDGANTNLNGPASLTEVTGPANPFDGLVVGARQNATPSFTDFDGDGDLDAFFGERNGSIVYFENDGAGNLTEQTGSANPLDGVNAGFFTAPAFADLDGDGDVDGFVGDLDGVVRFFQNDGSGNLSEQTGPANPFDGIDVGSFALPTFADLDNDGDLDAAIGAADGALRYFENDGAGNLTERTGASNPLNSVSVGGQAAPAFADIDADGDLDIFVGDGSGQVRFFENDGAGTFSEMTGTGNPLGFVNVIATAAPTFADLDGDGDLDAYVGDNAGLIHFYENNPPSQPVTLSVTITPENESPVVTGPVTIANLSEDDGAATINLIDGASDADGDTLTVTGVAASFVDNDGNSGPLTFADNGDGTISVDPGQFEGLGTGDHADVTVTFTIEDGNGGTVANTATFAVDGRNDAPVVAGPLDFSVVFENEGGSAFPLLQGASDPDGDALSINNLTATYIDNDGNSGVFALGLFDDGYISVDPDQISGLSQGERADVTVNFTIDDGNGGTVANTATFFVLGENDRPDARDDTLQSTEGASVIGNVLANDTDPDDNDTLSVFEAGNSAAGTAFAVTTTGGRSGTATVAANGDVGFAFDAADLALGQTDSFSFNYLANDGNNEFDSATANVTIVGDGPATVSGSAGGSLPNNNQQVSLSLTSESTSLDGTVDASFLINAGAIVQPKINVIYVMDKSGSTQDEFEPGGLSISLAQEQALEELTYLIEDQGFPPGTLTISVLPFAGFVDDDPSSSSVNRVQTFTINSQNDIDDVVFAVNRTRPITTGEESLTNYVNALEATNTLVDNLEAANGPATNLVYFLSDGDPYVAVLDPVTGQPTPVTRLQTPAEITPGAELLQSKAQISAIGLGADATTEFLDLIDNTSGSEIVTDVAALDAELLGSPVAPGDVIDADVFVFDNQGNQTNTIDIDPALLTEGPLGLALALNDIAGFDRDLGDMSTLQLVVQLDDDGDGVADLSLSADVDVFGFA